MFSLPQSPGPGTGTRLGWWGGSVYCGGVWAAGVKRQEREKKKKRHFAKSCAWPGWQADGAVLWNHYAYGVAHPLHIGRPPTADSGSPIKSHVDPTGVQSHDLPADLVVNRAACWPRRGAAGEQFLRERASCASTGSEYSGA